MEGLDVKTGVWETLCIEVELCTLVEFIVDNGMVRWGFMELRLVGLIVVVDNVWLTAEVWLEVVMGLWVDLGEVLKLVL